MNEEILRQICCPKCHSDIETFEVHYRCSKCQTNYPIVDTIPDFAIEVGDSLADDITKTNVLFYDSTAQHYEDDYDSLPKTVGFAMKGLIEKDTPSNSYSQKRIKEIISKYYDAKGLFLDIGCGTGQLLQLLGAKNIRALGIDISMQMLKEDKRRNPNCMRANNYRTPFKDNTFTMVSAFAVVHHMADLEMFFSEIFRILKKGGIVYTDSDPNPIALEIKEKSRLYNKIIGSVRNILRRDFDNLFHNTGIKRGDVDYHFVRASQSGYNIDNLESLWNNIGFQKVDVYYHSNSASIFNKHPFNEKIVNTIRKYLLHMLNPDVKVDMCSEYLLAVLQK